jgi:signal transduction histidine kinase
MPELKFTVDAKLLEELGERLVGKPSVALAELVKNAYDADAHTVEIGFYPKEQKIIIRDDGHGMDLKDFRKFWMRVGTTHKATKRVSPRLNRPMTGSKGVGRFAVQMLAKNLTVFTVTKQKPSWISAKVNWAKAVSAGDLTKASVIYKEYTTSPPFEHGTQLVLTDLNHEWTTNDLKELAREIWWLQSPFRESTDNLPAKDIFEIKFTGGEEYLAEFQEQLNAVRQIQTARISGHCKAGVANIVVEFWSRGSPYKSHSYTYQIADLPHNKGHFYPKKNLHEVRFNVRIYTLRGKQSKGIKLTTLKEYMNRFAGVHVYDGGFRLPYYGDPTNDWLQIEYDHAHRELRSQLLPESIQEKYKETQRLQYLPTLRRVFGIVHLDTGKEDNLEIAITRDRLISSKAHDDLRAIVRYAFDQYAYDEAKRAYLKNQGTKKTEKPSQAVGRIEDILDEYRESIPANVYRPLEKKLHERVTDATLAIKTEQDTMLAQLALLGPLATAGVSAIAIQHELRKQFSWLGNLIKHLKTLSIEDITLRENIQKTANDLENWLERSRATNALFDYMTGDTIQKTERYRIKAVLKQVIEQTQFLGRGVHISIDGVHPDWYFPEASFAEWGAILQNILTNAFNAMLDSEKKELRLVTRAFGGNRSLEILDTGHGVDLVNAADLFKPFHRETEANPERMRMGYGGTGLGLTIVRLLTDRVGCQAKFIKPEAGFQTAFSIEWKEKKAR